jgi:hypothetical protein
MALRSTGYLLTLPCFLSAEIAVALQECAGEKAFIQVQDVDASGS